MSHQFLGARWPGKVECHCGEGVRGKPRWHFATAHAHPQRVRRASPGIWYMQMSNIHTQEPQAGHLEVGTTIDKACVASPSHTVDVVRGDLHMTCLSKPLPGGQAVQWHEGTLGELEKRGYTPAADGSEE